jgi:hypothetical protein
MRIVHVAPRLTGPAADFAPAQRELAQAQAKASSGNVQVVAAAADPPRVLALVDFFKKYKNSTVTRYVYYGCTKARGADCKCGYTEEKDILRQFEELIDTISLNEIEVKEKIKFDLDRFSKMQKFFLGTKDKIALPNVDIRGYAKYVLREGTNEEKREMLGCLKSRIYLAEKRISLEKQGEK